MSNEPEFLVALIFLKLPLLRVIILDIGFQPPENLNNFNCFFIFISLEFLTYAHFGASRSRITFYFLTIWRDRLFGNNFYNWRFSANTPRKVRRANASPSILPHDLFDNPVFQRMKRYDRQPSPRLQSAYRFRYKNF